MEKETKAQYTHLSPHTPRTKLPSDSQGCPDCLCKEQRILELEEIVRNTTQLVAADKIIKEENDSVNQLKKELEERDRLIQDNRIEKTKLLDEITRLKEKVEIGQELELGRRDLVDFEFSLTLGDVRVYMAKIYAEVGEAGKVWFSGRLDKSTGNVVSAQTGRIVRLENK